MRKHARHSYPRRSDLPVRIGQSIIILGQFAISTDAQVVDKLHPLQGLFVGVEGRILGDESITDHKS